MIVAWAMGLGAILRSPADEASPTPWWDHATAFVSTSSPAQAARVHADAVMSGAGDDPTWGTYSERTRIVERAKDTATLHGQGMKVLAYIEGFGETDSFVAEIRRDATGGWVKSSRDPTLTRLFNTAWTWRHYNGSGVIHWIGPADYFDESDVVAPWTRSHPRYGSPAPTYPDGRPAEGQPDPNDPRTNRLYDATCSKDINGHVAFDYEYFPNVPTAGLLSTTGVATGPPDPGYTPAEWAKIKGAGYAATFEAGKDTACPIWIDYIRASVRQQLDAGIDGLWVDNYSPWDNFGSPPIQKAFGDWSVAGFPAYLRAHFSAAQLAALGAADAGAFDIRNYLRARCRAFGGNPDNLKDPKWRDPHWADDPLWHAYLIYKRQTGTHELSAFYHAIHTEAAAAGKPDFLVSGNDIPGYSLGWARGDLDLVSTELSSGWGQTYGPRGLMFPPYGSYVPVYQLAREHAKSRYVNAWMYVPKEERQKPNLARVLYAQALAFDATAMPHYEPGARTAGTEAVDAAFFEFLHRAAPLFRERTQLDEVGVYYSSSSQLMEILPGGFRNQADQPHSFAFYGWGTALTFLHVPWRAVPEWKLNLLSGLRVLIIPSADVFPSEDVATLRRWVEAGGSLVVAGACGTRRGEAGNFDRATPGSTLQPLLPAAGQTELALGRGRVVVMPVDPGIAFYRATQERPAQLPAFAAVLKEALRDQPPLTLEASQVDWKTNLSLHRDADALFVDLANTNLDPASDTLTPTPPATFTLALPAGWSCANVKVEALSPDQPPSISTRYPDATHLEVTVGPLALYTCVIVRHG